jgi:hypothetical protein
MIAVDAQAYLVCQGALLVWSPSGYRAADFDLRDATVSVLTPPSVVNAFRTGYVPEIFCRN